jgi:alpha-tubulin suppressor-like RCC1 family protein
MTDGTIRATGVNTYGACCLGHTTTPISTFTQTYLPTNIIDIKQHGYSSGGYHMLALDENGELYSWGYNGRYNINVDISSNYLVPFKINLNRW